MSLRGRPQHVDKQQQPSDMLKLAAELSSKDPAARSKAVLDFGKFLKSAAKKMTGESLTEHSQHIRGMILGLLQGKSKQENLGGVAAIIELLRVGESALTSDLNLNMLAFKKIDAGIDVQPLLIWVTLIGRDLQQVLPPFGSDSDVVAAATDAIGEIAGHGMGPITQQFVAKHAETALEWVEHSSKNNDLKRSAAVRILELLALKQPGHFFPYIPRVFKVIFSVVRDPKPTIRVAATATLRQCLVVWHGRSRYPSLYREIEMGFEDGREDWIHGSLLAAGAFVSHTGDYITETMYFAAVCDATLHYIDHKKEQVQHAAVELVPRLARLDRERFMSYVVIDKSSKGAVAVSYPTAVLGPIIKGLSRDRDRLCAMGALGELALEMGSGFKEFAAPVFAGLMTFLARRGKATTEEKHKIEGAICKCAASLVKALGSLAQDEVQKLLPTLCSFDAEHYPYDGDFGFTHPLMSLLQDIVENIPEFRKQIQTRVLDRLSFVLQGGPFRHPGAPTDESIVQPVGGAIGRKSMPGVGPTSGSHSSGRRLSHANSAHGSSSGTGGAGPASAADRDATERVVLALKTLREFDFRGHSLAKFARDSVVPLFKSLQPDIREAATTATATLIVPRPGKDGILDQRRVDPQVISQLLLKLLEVGISDRMSRIRRAVLQSLIEPLEPFLAKVEILRVLFVCLYDEDLSTRKLAIKVVGKLTNRNPAYVMPALRRLLTQLLNDLNLCMGAEAEERSAELVIELIKFAPRVVRPYVDAVIVALRAKLQSSDKQMFLLALTGIGELAVVAGPLMAPAVPELMELTLDSIKDKSSVTKSELAVRLLGKLTRSTGYVIEPYTDYPGLMTTLFQLLEGGKTSTLRQESVRALGILGALDPYVEKGNRIASAVATKAAADASSAVEGNGKPVYLGKDKAANVFKAGDAVAARLHSAPSEEFYQELVIQEIMAIAYEPALVGIHDRVIRSCAIMVVKAGQKFVPNLAKLIPAFLHMIKVCDNVSRHMMFNEVAKIISIFGPHMRSYIGDILNTACEFWLETSAKNRVATTNMHTVIKALLRASIKALGGEFTDHMPKLLQHLLGVFPDDDSEDREATKMALEALGILGGLMDSYMPSVVSAAIGVVKQYAEIPLSVRQAALDTLAQCASQSRIGNQTSTVVHVLSRVLKYDDDLRPSVLPVLELIMCELGQAYISRGHLQMVDKVLTEVGHSASSYSKYRELAGRLMAGETIESQKRGLLTKSDRSNSLRNLPEAPQNRVNRTTQVMIMRLANEAMGPAMGIDWADWVRRFNQMLFKESRSTALASCQALAESHPPTLFTPAFISCWLELTTDEQALLTEGLERAMHHDQTFMQLMLNVAEFMSHYPTSQPLPIKTKVFGQMALECRTYAKALRYLEQEFVGNFRMSDFHNGLRPAPVDSTVELLDIVEDLIKVDQALQEPEAAQGVLAFIRHNMTSTGGEIIKPSWYEKLGEWDRALVLYEQKLADDPLDFQLALGRMRCLDNLGKWKELHDLVEGAWPHATDKQRRAASVMACSAAAGLGAWNACEKYLPEIESDVDSKFFGAMLRVYRGEYDAAAALIVDCRKVLEPVLTSLWRESYSRGYGNVVKVQILAELEEVIEYMQVPEPAARLRIREMWRKRLDGCQYDSDVWLEILKVRSLVLSPEEGLEPWLKYCSLCCKQDRSATGHGLGLERAHTKLVSLLGCDPSEQPQYALPVSHPTVTYAYIKHMWMTGQHDDAIQHLYQLVDFLSGSGSGSPRGIINDSKTSSESEVQDQALLARCYHKLGQWQSQPYTDAAGGNSAQLTDDVIQSILESFHYATLLDRSWYKAWHAWAFMSFEAVTYYENTGNTKQKLAHAVMAITGFFNSIGLCNAQSSGRIDMNGASDSNLRDTLRLLTLWFKFGGNIDVATTIAAGVSSVSVDTWLQVIPQLIARIQITDSRTRQSIHDLLIQIGRVHTQALLFPLTVAAHNFRDSDSSRREAAEHLLSKMRDHSPTLVDQALMVSQELIRVAILWSEMWFEGLEEASKLYTDHDHEGMFAVLTPLHDKLNDIGVGATARELEFVEVYGKDLRDAWDKCKKFQRTGNKKDLSSAWDHYYFVYRNVSKSLPSLTSLHLRDVSPKLHEARKLKLVVPGRYLRTEENVCIEYIVPQLAVIGSKQRPRRLTIRGSDGKDYEYLLKAHEDLRQDERVMQLFGLVNQLLNNDPSTAHRHLDIRTYFVLPLTPNLGLIEWVPTCDTFHWLIRDHRERNRIVLNMEVRLMVQMTPDYESLTLIQKVEIFRHALANMPGDDIARVLWLHSGDSEAWIDRRATYTRTLAVMSMVGYILGLGDRHPSNLMLDRQTGAVMHVDFGDCFEVAMRRPKFPERVPFRLTRMLVKAMEISGIEGNFRITCENVMRVMRNNADSVVAVLEAFVHDPLIDWFVKDRKGNNREEQQDLEASTDSFGHGDDLGGRLDRHNSGSDFESADGGGRHISLSAAISPVYDGGSRRSNRDGVPEVLNSRALKVLQRIKDKLAGQEWLSDERMDVPTQVQRLITKATAHENLCQHYTGWCPFW